MKWLVKKFQRTFFFLWKTALYVCLLWIFVGLFSIPNPPLSRPSRTLAVTLLTFCAVGIGMTAAYGRFDIGRRKSKPIIYSLGLAVFITDIVTYVQLSVMNTNPDNNATLKFENAGLLIIVVGLQIVLIVLMTYLGNYFYFRMNRPEICCVITSSENSLEQICKVVSKYKKQYEIKYVLDYRAKDLFDTILKSHTIFMYDVPVKDRTEIFEFCYRHSRNIYFNPEVPDVVAFNAQHVVLDDVSLIQATVEELSIEQRFIKRMMDVVISIAGLIISSPIWLVSAICIKFEDGGKILFKQKRATKNGKVFEVYKFRTMKENVTNYSSTAGDSRITKTGKILRKFRIDEFPQLINILKGEMSVVGPRPEMLENVYSYTAELPEFEYRLRVKAGLTGYAQIAGKYNTSPRDKLILDLMYIENYSVWKDIKLILQTLIVLFKGDSTEAFNKDDDIGFMQYSEDKKIINHNNEV
ncbi:sugar transferase [Frisingicoccus sp.]|uniref:sugar transferase n=1 Tax=Frisingicoccus sp. TaxID=1918627 RepID=UPI003AB7EEC5